RKAAVRRSSSVVGRFSSNRKLKMCLPGTIFAACTTLSTKPWLPVSSLLLLEKRPTTLLERRTAALRVLII
ncbi:MAG: hypothetical protein AAFO03_21975, partial [Bacteroidota bacterium]